ARRPDGAASRYPELQPRMADPLPLGAGQEGAAEGDAGGVRRPVRQLAVQPVQPRPDQDGQGWTANVPRDDERIPVLRRGEREAGLGRGPQNWPGRVEGARRELNCPSATVEKLPRLPATAGAATV